MTSKTERLVNRRPSQKKTKTIFDEYSNIILRLLCKIFIYLIKFQIVSLF